MQVRNIAALPDGRFDCEVDHPRFGWIPFTASAEDSEPLGRLLHAEITVHGENAMQITGLRFVDAAGTVRGLRMANGEPDPLSAVEAPPGADANIVARTGILGPVAAWVAPVPVATMERRRATAMLERLDFGRGLQAAQILTHQQKMVFLANGLPQPILDLIAMLDEDQREAAEEAMAGAQRFYRADPMWDSALEAGAVTVEQLDTLFGISEG